MEIRGEFEIDKNKYTVFIKKGPLKIKNITLFEHSMNSRFLRPIPIKTSASTLNELKEYWLIKLQLHLAKHRRKKRS